MWGDPRPERVGFVAESQGRVVGFLVAREIAGEWELENVAVAPEASCQGIGTSLIEDLLRKLRKERAQRVFLEVRESNFEARKLYERQGFQLVGRRNRYYSGPEEDALLFEKKLADLSMKIR
jgi:ribosomal-protein-alanine N-acetyltransferase